MQRMRSLELSFQVHWDGQLLISTNHPRCAIKKEPALAVISWDKWWFSIVMLVYQRVSHCRNPVWYYNIINGICATGRVGGSRCPVRQNMDLRVGMWQPSFRWISWEINGKQYATVIFLLICLIFSMFWRYSSECGFTPNDWPHPITEKP